MCRVHLGHAGQRIWMLLTQQPLPCLHHPSFAPLPAQKSDVSKQLFCEAMAAHNDVTHQSLLRSVGTADLAAVVQVGGIR